MVKAGNDANQLKITSFFDTIFGIIEENQIIKQAFDIAQEQRAERCLRTNNISPLLKYLLENAQKNVSMLPKQRRHLDILKKFATSLFIYSGPMTYEFLHRNMQEALPSLRTVQRIVSEEYQPIQEGLFRFEELSKHLQLYNAPKVVCIGEDATRVISRVDYDNETNRLVGFVLPFDEAGLPICGSYIASSFDSIVESFQIAEKAKYAFVYMAQPLHDGVPPFCLACLSTDNRFSADTVLKRWKYIHSECSKRGIRVVSFGADGDSRELKAMQMSMKLYLSTLPSALTVVQSIGLSQLKIPNSWYSWFACKNPTSVAYIQDIVHIAVKLKSRLMNPSIVLPMGKYLAGSHHLLLIQKTFGKDQHGMRERDLNHKDKQNFDAVLHITSKSVENLLTKIPDATGTSAYLEVIRCVVDSFLDKKEDVLCKIRKAWYSVFFLRYWRKWVILSPGYKIRDNFVTNNAYMCVEMNAHSLITFIMTVRDALPCETNCFMPWLMGSQSCEKIFRAARSMSSTFSTCINFGMLGLMRRLHRLHIQLCLEAESENTGIHYPRAERHKCKDGTSNFNLSCANASTLQNHMILDAVNMGKEEAKKMISCLGMSDLLKRAKCWENPPIPTDISEDDLQEEEEDDENILEADICEVLQEITLQEDADQIASGISELSEVGFIESGLSKQLTTLHKSVFKRVPDNSLPLYVEDNSTSKKAKKSKKYSSLVEMKHNEKVMYIHKTTVVWLMQEGERVSSDRLFRVRSTQPYSSKPQPQIESCTTTAICPAVKSTLEVGDLCAFSKDIMSWKFGRILKFCYYKEQTKKKRQYAGVRASLSSNPEKIGALCSWYTSSEEKPALFRASVNEEEHIYYPITSYLCTLSHGCFENIDQNFNAMESSILSTDQMEINLLTAQNLTFTSGSLLFIKSLLEDKRKILKQKVVSQSENISCKSSSGISGKWVCHGRIHLNKKDRHDISSGKELSDLHVNAYQCLLKEKLSFLHGLQNTLLQHKIPLNLKESSLSLQIIHVRNNHWIALEISGSTVSVYDSSYISLSADTQNTIAQLIHCKEKEITTNIMNISKQTGLNDCALFAMAVITHLAIGEDPTTVIFDQDGLRSHLTMLLESGNIYPFPVLRKRRQSEKIHKVQTFKIYCDCRMPYCGELMVKCNTCCEWYHYKCIQETTNETENELRKTDTIWNCHHCHCSSMSTDK